MTPEFAELNARVIACFDRLFVIEAPIMANPPGEANDGAPGLDFDLRLTVQFRGSIVPFGAGSLAHRERDDALGLSAPERSQPPWSSFNV